MRRVAPIWSRAFLQRSKQSGYGGRAVWSPTGRAAVAATAAWKRTLTIGGNRRQRSLPHANRNGRTITSMKRPERRGFGCSTSWPKCWIDVAGGYARQSRLDYGDERVRRGWRAIATSSAFGRAA